MEYVGKGSCSHVCVTVDICMVGKGKNEENVSGKGAITLISLSREKDVWRTVVICEERWMISLPITGGLELEHL